MKPSSNYVSIAGEFAVLSQLALRGIDANLTLGNTKSVDILASDPQTGKMIRLEVKTSYNKRPSNSKLFGRSYSWIMSKKHESIIDPGLLYCFVSIEDDGQTFRFFVIPSDVVARYVKIQHRFWLDQTPTGKDTSIRMFRIGIDPGGYAIETPFAEEYENKWELITR